MYLREKDKEDGDYTSAVILSRRSG